ncbi:MAG: hypothetical protein AAGF74_13310 [Pseudomonadota bacterium]
MGQAQARPVRRRQVFYIPGYDPFPARRYRELYRSEGAQQAGISGYTLSVQGGETPGAWTATSVIEGAETSARVDVLGWSDLVKSSMAAGILATYGQLLRTAWIYISTGALWRLARLRKGPLLAVLYPVGGLVLQALVALGIAFLVFRLVAGVSVPFAALVSFGVAWGLFHLFKARDGRFFVHYLMHDYAFSAKDRGAYAEGLSARIDAFADRVAGVRGADEILIVGHSSGAHLAVSVLARLVRQGRLPDTPAVSLLTLGHVVPMLSFLPDADELRADLATVGAARTVAWVDVTAPGDGCCFALCHPLAVSGVPVGEGDGPLVISAAFSKTLSGEAQQKMRWRFFRIHFQYLCAFDRPGDYDYFQITAGPLTLGARYTGRKPSPGMIRAPVSAYRTLAA